MSQITSLVKAPNAAEKARVLVRTAEVRPRKAQAPTGRGLRTSPAMVERKMASSCHARVETCGGFGTRNRTASPIDTEITSGMSLAPPPPRLEPETGGGEGGGGGDDGDRNA